MEEAANKRLIVAVKFGFSDKTYDYFSDIPVEVGQTVYVETSRGEAKVQIMEIKDASDRAEKSVLRIFVPETADAPGEAA
ncbi:hypothetical protein [Phyllobacterium calauticae]|jgi:hypothetical protein|uniref:hypothetical protein n=1 Tax=Phyllobacterium calauticae TaxID=2817027 RepID=UPI001CBC79A9|nr:hypothetical protein [Phyllobacterium calauticae]MBZ3691027.1 hypothetical protein [Phyllobacterium calauticae]